jgi:hypothetical protein
MKAEKMAGKGIWRGWNVSLESMYVQNENVVEVELMRV